MSAVSSPQSDEPYVVLARRYRPQTFAQVVGQENVRTALSTAIASGQIGHAYLFSGPRGTGKTSTARILAKALNCQRGGPRPDPCGQCPSCRGIEAGNSLDVIEIDAASNTGVDNIRDLRSGVVLAPFSRYKVYIIDEVHMLSTQAFNALLKTLEEPPAQVVFVLATTELQKVPETIVSRCQSFVFRRFTVEEIVGQLDGILEAECKRRHLSVAPADRQRILELIARNAEGGMRDAQVMLDQVLVLSEDKLDFDSVARFLGAIETDILDGFTRALASRQIEQLLTTIDDLVMRGHDLERFVKSFAAHLRDVLIVKSAPQKPELLNVSPDRMAMLRKLASDMPLSFLVNTSEAFLRLLEDLKTASQARFLVELAVIRLCTVDAVNDIAAIVTRLQNIESSMSGFTGRAGDVRPAAGASPVTSRTGAPVNRPAPPPADRVEESSADKHRGDFAKPAVEIRSHEVIPSVSAEMTGVELSPERFLAELRERCAQHNHFLHVTLLETSIKSFNGHIAVLGIKPTDRFTHDHLSRPKNQEMLKTLAREITGKEITFRLQFDDAPAGRDAASPAATIKPAGASTTAAPKIQEDADPVENDPDDGAGAGDADIIEEMASDHANDEAVINKMLGPKVYRDNALREFASKHTDLARLIDRLKTALQLDDSNFTFRLNP